MEDTIFDPWGTFERTKPAPAAAAQAPPHHALRPGRTRRWMRRAVTALTSTPRGPTEPPALAQPTDAETPLADVVRAHLAAVVCRLRAARHGAVVTELVQEDPASIRLRIEPWVAPLADRFPGLYPELEFIFSSSGQDLRVRTWVGPEEALPDRDGTVPADGADEHIRRIVLDFVALALA